MPFDLSPPPLWLPPKPAIVRALSREQLVLSSFLPGMFVAGAAAAEEAVLTTLTEVGTGTSTATNGAITSSVTIQAGDLLVIWGYAISSAVAPPNFNLAATALNSGGFVVALYYKIATGSEGTSVTGTSGAITVKNALYVFRGDVPITSVAVGSPAGVNTDNNPTAQVVAASGGTPPLVVVGGYNSNSAVSPRTMSPAKDGEINPDTTFYLAYKIYNSAPADVSVDMDDEGTGNRLASCYLACA